MLLQESNIAPKTIYRGRDTIWQKINFRAATHPGIRIHIAKPFALKQTEFWIPVATEIVLKTSKCS